MKEKWIEDLRDALSDFEMDAPEGLWESLGVEAPAPVGSWRRKAAVAASILTLLSVGSGLLLWLGRMEDIDISQTAADARISQPETNGVRPSRLLPAEAEHFKSVTATSVRKIIVHTDVAEEEIYIPQGNEGENTVSSPDTVSREIPDGSSAEDIKMIREYADMKGKSIYAGISPVKRSYGNHSGRFAVAAYASGIGQASGRLGRAPGPNTSDDLFLGNGDPNFGVNFPGEDPDQNGFPDFEFPDGPRPEEMQVTTEIHHHQPIRGGITFQYILTDRVALETGLMYTALSSDITLSHGNRSSSGHRRMHYIGIPLNVKLSLWSWKSIDLYISAGVIGEKCVSNRFRTESEAGGLPLERFSSQKDKPWQWSVNAAPGVQIKPLPDIGIFAEPGVSYYFDDGSPISTIYKDHPCNFNLNLGVRWMINPSK